MDVAIIGHAFNLPGARNLREFGELIYNAKDAFTSSGANGDRKPQCWVNSAGYPEALYQFDYKLLDISLRDSLIIEPQQRMFIQHCWKALENAGYNPSSVDAEVGVYSTSSDSRYSETLAPFASLREKYDPFELEIGTNKEQQSLRTSYLLNLRGPSLGVQSACSSGLVTVHVAIQALRCGDCDIALAGGACLPSPLHIGYTYREGMNLSRSGKSRSFDCTADGMVPGFGCVVFVLKRLENAIRDSDCIYAVIKGSAVNNDGRVKSTYMSPSTKAIARNIQKLFSQTAMRADDVDFIEAHGSATKIGDVIEASALRLAFSGSARPERSTAVSSVKSAIGHLDTVAGLAGLLKAMLQVWCGKIAPAANFTDLNENISFSGTPLFVPTAEVSVRLPGGIVNSLGIGGTNCAVLVVAPPEVRELCREEDSEGAYDVYVGAKDERSLRKYAADLHAELRDTKFSLRDIAWTLSRRAMRKNLIVLCRSATLAELSSALQQCAIGVCNSLSGTLVTHARKGIAVAISSSEVDEEVEVKVESSDNKRSVYRPSSARDILAGIWQRHLMIEHVDDGMSFINGGGHSILALSFIDDIRKNFDVDIDFDWVETHDSFREQLHSIESARQGTVRRSNVKILRQAQGDIKARLVLIHASISGCETYRTLARNVAPNVEVIGVDSHNLYADECAMISSMDDLVHRYCVEVEETISDTKTPMIIGGWSLGGMMSNLASKRLRERYTVSGLIAIDSVLYDRNYQEIFSDDNINYFVVPSSVLGLDSDPKNVQVKRLRKVFDIERKMAVSFRPAVADMPLLNVVATESRNMITDLHVRNSFDLAKIDNGWKSAMPLKTVYFKTFHDGIVDSVNSVAVAALINEFINVHV